MNGNSFSVRDMKYYTVYAKCICITNDFLGSFFPAKKKLKYSMKDETLADKQVSGM